MSRFVYFTGVSLDGFVADARGALDWLTTCEIDPAGPGSPAGFEQSVGALVMGRTTYDWVAAALAEANEPWPHRQPTWVLTRGAAPATAPDAQITFTDAPIAEVARAMRAAAGQLDCWVVGGGQLATSFAEAGLLDEVVVAIAPVVLGAGVPVLSHGLSLRLLKVERNRDFAVLRYAVGRSENS